MVVVVNIVFLFTNTVKKKIQASCCRLPSAARAVQTATRGGRTLSQPSASCGSLLKLVCTLTPPLTFLTVPYVPVCDQRRQAFLSVSLVVHSSRTYSFVHFMFCSSDGIFLTRAF